MTETPTASAPRHSPLGLFLRGLLALALLSAAAGVIYENISEARDRRFNPMLGSVVDSGDHKMHIYCTGQGSPSVILDSGLGDTYIAWNKVQPEIAKFTRVCSYDRAGMGYSESSSRPRTSTDIAEELHALLGAAGVPPPYVLVGHSEWGYNVSAFARMYRKEVTGVMLVNALHSSQGNGLPSGIMIMKGTIIRKAEFMEFTMPFGIPRLLGLCGEDPERRAAECNFHTIREDIAELKDLSADAVQTNSVDTFENIPFDRLIESVHNLTDVVRGTRPTF